MKKYIVDAEGKLKPVTSANEIIRPAVAVIDVNGETFFGPAKANTTEDNQPL